MQDNYPHVEKRSEKRMRAELEMSYWKTDEEGSPKHAVKTMDVSTRSVLFEEGEVIPIGTKIEAEVIIPTVEACIAFSGWINRIKEREEGDGYQYCVMFEEISDEHLEVIERYIEVVDVNQLLRLALEKHSSDVHVMAGHPPILRIEGELVALDQPPFSSSDLKFMIQSMLTTKQRQLFEKNHDMNFSYIIPEGGSFRVNVHLDRGHVEASIRIIPSKIKPLAELGLPEQVVGFADRKKGLVLITGPVGSGKTTTLTSMVDAINTNRKCMIVSIEDPIEHVYPSKMSFVKQREVGADTLSFADGLKNALRQDPNVILVSDLRDMESISLAMAAAETGILVLATMNTSGIVDCLEKLIDVFPSDQRDQSRARLANCLEGVSSQFLVPRKEGKGRVSVCEAMIMSRTLRKLIREGKLSHNSQFTDSGFNTGILDLDDSLRELVDKGLIDEEVACSFARKPEKFNRAEMLNKLSV